MGGNRGNTDGSKSSLNTGKSERQVLYWQREVLNQDLVLQKYFWEIDKCVRLFTQFRRSITITCLIMLLCGVFSGGHFLIVPCVFLLLIFCCSYVLLILFVLSSCCFHFFFFSIFCWSWYSQLHWELTLSLHNSRKDYWKGLKGNQGQWVANLPVLEMKRRGEMEVEDKEVAEKEKQESV